MDSILQVGATVVALFAVMAAWYLLQAYVQRKSGCRRGTDVLEYMAHGCANCKGDGACRKGKNVEAGDEHK